MMEGSESDICRTCLLQNKNLLSLSSNHNACGNVLNAAEIINYLSFGEIILNDELPQFICPECIEQMVISYNFKKKCESSEKYLKGLRMTQEENVVVNCKDKKYVEFCDQVASKSNLDEYLNKHSTNKLRATRRSSRIIKNSIEECIIPSSIDPERENIEIINKNYPTDKVLKEEEIKDESMEPWFLILKHANKRNLNGFYECISCSSTYTEMGELRLHLRSHKLFRCKLCSKDFTLLSNLRRHLRAHANDTRDPEFDMSEASTTDGDVKFFKCIGCPEIFSKRRQLSEHLKTHNSFTCSICNVKFTFATNLRKHLRYHSQPEFKVWKQIPQDKRTCDICNKVFKYRPSMLKHRKKHASIGKTCQYCEQIFENSIKLYKHMEENHEHEKNIECKICRKKFFRIINLKMHMIVHSGQKPFLCEICGVSFALGGNLASHRRLHTGQKPYKCQTCGRGFTQQAALRSHEAGHSNRRDYVCAECGAAFSRAGAMRNHRKRHEGKKPYQCPTCLKRFTFSTERKRHMNIHTGEKFYVCDFCGKSFNRPTNLTVHKKIHTGEKPHRCDVCGKGFIQAHCLRTHLNTHKMVSNNEENDISNMESEIIVSFQT